MRALDCRGLVAAAGLDFDVHVDQRDGGGRDSGNARGLGEGAGAHLGQLFLHFAGKAADRAVVEPIGDVALLGFLQAIDGALLLSEIACVLDFGFDGLEFVATSRRELNSQRVH